MRKLFLVLPTLLLLATPVAALAEKDGHENHGSEVSVVAKENDDDHGSRVSIVAKDNHGTNLENRENDEDEGNEIEREDHHKNATVSANANGNQQLKIKIKIKGNNSLGSAVSATHSATPSAHINVSGPLDQVIKALEQIINFLKSLV